MQCRRCSSRMITSHLTECEVAAGIVLYTEVFVNECPKCTAIVKVIMPPMPTEQPQLAG